ncbi:MAG TPA: gliding motility-associated C-terminal domain-containing protein, partial [Chitinophagaceae bacterium]|nr:gliding motility-associated C-terminal domain-containing protein [Chitinophagaceae bacterium]
NIYLDSRNSYKAPGGTLVLTGERRSSNTNNFLISRIDTNGNMLWTRYVSRITGGSSYLMNSNYSPKNIFVSNDAIYFSIGLSFYDMVGKLDLNGNLLWSRGVASGSPPFSGTNKITDGLFEKNGIVYFASNTVKNGLSGNNISGVAITQLSDANGNLINSTFYKIVPDNYAKGFSARYLYPYKDGSFSLTGYIGVSSDPNNIGIQSNTRFNVQMDSSLNPLPAYYYKTNTVSDVTFQFDMNTEKQSIFLINNDDNQTKYFVSFDWNQQLLRSRKFIVPTRPSNAGSAINIDDKQNIHFIYNYRLNNQAITEYARLSDLAPANTLQCFGIDTASIFQRFPFILTQEPYTWPFTDSTLVNCLPVNIYTENAVINKEVVCKQVSYCDSLKIKGNSNVCITGPDARYSVYLNPQCLKSINWQIDTSFATLINAEADSAVTLRFKKSGNFYLRAAVNNCVVSDSMLITIPVIQTNLQLNKADSLLCPGKTILLQVNPSFKTYQWQDGSNQNTYTVTSPGLFTITATDSCGNVVTDSILIKQDSTVIPVFPNYKICVYDTVNVLLPASLTNLTWQPSLFGSFGSNKLMLYPLQTTTYTIQAQSPAGCNIRKQVTVETEVCPEWVRFPSAFTPNNDGLNDSFRPGVSGHLVSYNLKLFDRNGQIVFSSKNPYAGWDGKLKGAEQNSGIFVFMCYHRFINKAEVMQKGTLMLIR